MTKNASIVHLFFLTLHAGFGGIHEFVGFLIMLVFQSRISNYLFLVNARKSLKSLKSLALSSEKSESYITQTRPLLVALSLACFEPVGLGNKFCSQRRWCCYAAFPFIEYKTSVICHNLNTQNVKIAGRAGRTSGLVSHRCETFENLVHLDIAPVRRTLSGNLHSKY